MLLIAFAINVADAQVAGNPPYTLEQAVIASGGGTSTDAGSIFSLTGTTGQFAAGTNSTNSPFTVRSGFFTVPSFAPTAASVMVSGRILTLDGNGLTNARVILTNSQGNSWMAISSSFGYYRFDDVAVGETYILTVSSKRYQFNPQVVTVMEEITELNFSAIP